MNKKYLAIVLIILSALTFTAGCVQQQPSGTVNETNLTGETQAAGTINENDNLEPALQELDEIESL